MPLPNSPRGERALLDRNEMKDLCVRIRRTLRLLTSQSAGYFCTELNVGKAG